MTDLIGLYDYAEQRAVGVYWFAMGRAVGSATLPSIPGASGRWPKKRPSWPTSWGTARPAAFTMSTLLWTSGRSMRTALTAGHAKSSSRRMS